MTSTLTLEKKLETIFKQELKRNNTAHINASLINKHLSFRVLGSDDLIHLNATIHPFTLVKTKYDANIHCTDFIFTLELAENDYVPVLSRDGINKKYSSIRLLHTKSLRGVSSLFIKIRCSVYSKHHVKVVIDSTHELSNVELVNFSKHYICTVTPKLSLCGKIKKFINNLFQR